MTTRAPKHETRTVPGSRERLIRAANHLFGRQGYEATGLKDVAAQGAAPIGSLYFHFPGGKQELALAAMAYGVEDIGDLIASALNSSRDLGTSFAAVARSIATRLESADWDTGCPIATTALEMASRSETLRASTHDGLTRWRGLFAERAMRAGVPKARANDLAASALALLEGAELLSRVEQSIDPLRAAGRAMKVLAANAEAKAGPKKGDG